MSYDHSNEIEGGDSMSGSQTPSNRKSKPSDENSPSAPKPAAPKPSASPHATTSKSLHKCSYCGQEFERALSKHMPFCSKRCQHIDLGMWLNESYGLPHEGESSLDSYGVEEADEDY